MTTISNIYNALPIRLYMTFESNVIAGGGVATAAAVVVAAADIAVARPPEPHDEMKQVRS